MTPRDADDDNKKPSDGSRIRFTLRELLGLVTVGCLLAGLALWNVWWFDERVLLLTWGISLTVSDRTARFFGRTAIWWPVCASVLAVAIAFFLLREETFVDRDWTWGEYAWNVSRLWAVLLVAAALASLIVLVTVRSLPKIPATVRTVMNRWRCSSRRSRWLAISFAAVAAVALAGYWMIGRARWSPYRTASLPKSSLPNVHFWSDTSKFVTVDNSGVTLWDWDAASVVRRMPLESSKSDEPPVVYSAVFKGDRLAITSSNNDPVKVYSIPEWRLKRTIEHGDTRTNPICGLYSVKDPERLITVDRSLTNGTILFSSWDDRGCWTDVSYEHGTGGADVGGISPSGRHAGITETIRRDHLDRTRLVVIDFDAMEVVLQKEFGPSSGPVVFFDVERRVAHSTHVFALDGSTEGELSGVILNALPDGIHLILVEFRSILPEWLSKPLENVPIVGNLGYFDRVRLVIADPVTEKTVARSRWFHGWATRIIAEMSSDGRRLIWADNQGRLLLWKMPAPNESRR